MIENQEIEAKIYNLRAWISGTERASCEKLDGLLRKIGFKILDFKDFTFPNNSYTALWLLAESHLAVHSFVGSGKTYVELSGCNASKTALFTEAFFQEFEVLQLEKNTL